MISYRVFTDGGSRGNPGPAATGIVVFREGKLIYQAGEYLGQTTNNVAEYQALAQSVNWFLMREIREVTVDWFLDSKLVVEQVNRRWKIKDVNLLQLARQIWQGLEQLKFNYTITHVLREKNQLADATLNQILNTY